jgi:predicted nucleic acid-binding protein
VISFDTNVLIYAADRDDSLRHQQAAEWLERAMRSGNCVQTLQSLAEFFNVFTRKSAAAPGHAATFVTAWRAVFAVEAASLADLDHAMRAVREYQLSFWDALLWATVRRMGVAVLVSEDFQDGRVVEGVRFANPFVPTNAPIIAAAIEI